MKEQGYWVSKAGTSVSTMNHTNTAGFLLRRSIDPVTDMFKAGWMRVSVQSSAIWFETSRTELKKPNAGQRRFLLMLKDKLQLELINGFNGRKCVLVRGKWRMR